MPLRTLFRRPGAGTGILHWIHTFALHIATGALAVVAHYAAMYSFVRAGVPGVGASALGFGAGALTRFALSYGHVFAPSRGMRVAGTRFAAAIALQLAMNTLLLIAFLALGLSLWPAQITTTVLMTFGNYLIYRLWVFR
ncbi:MAG: GtrA family protein [Betaproteobacteria bacterium]